MLIHTIFLLDVFCHRFCIPPTIDQHKTVVKILNKKSDVRTRVWSKGSVRKSAEVYHGCLPQQETQQLL